MNDEWEQAKLAALAQFAYGAGHEINNPLTNIASRAQALLAGETDPERRRKLAIIHSQAFRAYEMIADLMLYAKPPPMKLARINVGELLVQVAGELAADAERQSTHVICEPATAPIWIQADGEHLAVAIRSLCLNSLEALGQGGVICIRVEAHPGAESPPGSGGLGGSPWVSIVVQDDGPGVPADIRPHIFDPYFSGREAGRGLGVGLCKSWRIATLHGGTLRLDAGSSRGACFRMELPAGEPL